MSNILSENWSFITLAIENDLQQVAGTGFLVGATTPTEDAYGGLRPSWVGPVPHAYLVTARHVLGANASDIECTVSFWLRYNASRGAGLELARREFMVENSPPNWHCHPDPNVDVAALDVTSWLTEAADAHVRFCPMSELANPVGLLDIDCDAGDDAFVLGYPLRLRQGRSNLPIIRRGVLATSPRRPLEDSKGIPLRGFLVDGAIMPGSSGSPVVSASTRFYPGDLAATAHRPLALGVVTEEWGRGEGIRYKADATGAPVPIEGYANLGFAHSASTVIETLELFGHYTRRDFLRVDHDQHWAPALGVPEWSLDLDGNEVDSRAVQQIGLRLHRDRMRKRGHHVEPSEFHDAIAFLGQPK